MAQSSFSFRTVSQLFPSFSGKVSGAITLMLMANLLSLVLLGTALYIPSVQLLLVILAGMTFLAAIVIGLMFANAITESMQATIGEISSLSKTSRTAGSISRRLVGTKARKRPVAFTDSTTHFSPPCAS